MILTTAESPLYIVWRRISRCKVHIRLGARLQICGNHNRRARFTGVKWGDVIVWLERVSVCSEHPLAGRGVLGIKMGQTLDLDMLLLGLWKWVHEPLLGPEQ
jgi:hypothetical protein